ncbi:MAG: hypothetical protein LBG92_09430 [Prevotellaceae bacterium]|nr:hypothetical protein [Prevotellaceae bacterium]
MKKNNLRQFAAIFMSCILCAQTYAQQHKTTFLFVETAPGNIRNIMQNNADALFEEIHRAQWQNKSTLSLKNITPEAEKRINSIWETSHFYCLKSGRIIKKVLAQRKLNGAVEKYQVRSIPVFFEQGKDAIEQNQEIVIEFTPDGKICDMYCAITGNRYNDIIGGADSVKDLSNREIIVNFVDNFKTAYNCKDLDYLQNVYSENALIITGRVLQSGGKSPKPVQETKKEKEFEYSVENKKQYLDRLGRIFRNNKYVNIKFDSIMIVQKETMPIYGVTLKQDWTTKPSEKSNSGYHDEGWLFLLIDFSDTEKPTVWVRTWQPLTDDKGNVITKDRIFNPYDFPF